MGGGGIAPRESLPEACDREVGKPSGQTWRRSENELVKREGGEGRCPERGGERLYETRVEWSAVALIPHVRHPNPDRATYQQRDLLQVESFPKSQLPHLRREL